jgi:hypothetical protein
MPDRKPSDFDFKIINYVNKNAETEKSTNRLITSQQTNHIL